MSDKKERKTQFRKAMEVVAVCKYREQVEQMSDEQLQAEVAITSNKEFENA